MVGKSSVLLLLLSIFDTDLRPTAPPDGRGAAHRRTPYMLAAAAPPSAAAAALWNMPGARPRLLLLPRRLATSTVTKLRWRETNLCRGCRGALTRGADVAPIAADTDANIVALVWGCHGS